MVTQVYNSENLTFPVQIPSEMDAIAKKACQKQANASRVRSVYLNTIAVLATHFYCQCMGIDADLSSSESLDCVSPTLIDIADLPIKGKGILECRPILPGESEFHVPLEVCSDRIGYIFVEVDEVSGFAKLVGFLEEVKQEKNHRSDIKPLEYFLLSMQGLTDLDLNVDKPVPMSQIVATTEKILTRLNLWFGNLFDDGWQPESLILAGADRGKDLSTQNEISIPEANGAKILRLTQNPAQSVILVVQQHKITSREIEICIRLYPASESLFLPEDLTISILDSENEVVPNLSATASASNWLEHKFSAFMGDRFSIQISLTEHTLVEGFIV